jgi:hypothetical protein
MRGILADINAEGILTVLVRIWESGTWREFWHDLGLSIQDFDDLGLPLDSSDRVIWRTCQDQSLVLITGNRNADEPDSLELVIRIENKAASLPVVTLANSERVLNDRIYAEKTAEKLLDYLTHSRFPRYRPDLRSIIGRRDVPDTRETARPSRQG